MPPLLFQLYDIKHRYRKEPVLEIDSLTLEKGTITGFSGPNGSGKTTLLKILAFIRKPSEGTVLFKEKPAEPFSESVRFRVTYLSQAPYLLKKSVFDNIAYGLKLRKESGNITGKVYEALASVGLPGDRFAPRKWHELSGGEAKRVALASRLVLKPEVLILDEPTANVDAESCQLIREASLKARDEWGATLVIASHDSQWLYGVCDQVLNLFKGHLRGNGRTNIIFGPWIKRTDGRYEKQNQPGQAVIVESPPSKNAVAMIPPESLKISEDAPSSPKDSITLKGILSGLDMDKGSGDVFASVTVGTALFSVRIGNSRHTPPFICPGTPVCLSYHPESIVWYEK